MSKRGKFYLFVCFQILFLLLMIGMKQFTLYTGKKILLEIVPIDPRDIFRGEYVRLNYKISTIKLPNVREIKKNSVVYVTLKKTEKYWEPLAVNQEKPILGEGEIFLVGKKRWGNHIEYGIESFFVPEGKAIEIERDRENVKSVEVSVDRFGNSVIHQILINDKPLKQFIKD